MDERKTEEAGTSSRESSGWDGFVKKEIERFLKRYQALETAVRSQGADETVLVHVHVPYMMGTVTWVDQPEILARQRLRHQARLQRVKVARERAPPEVQAFFRRWFYDQEGGERLVAKGRSGPEEIRQLLQAAVDADLVLALPDTAHLDSHALRAWLQQYGIGVDCSAFVQHTLTHLLDASYAAVGDSPDSAQETAVGWMRAASVHRKVTENAEDRRFDLVVMPADARPGDILVSKGHTRIIVDIRSVEKGALIVTLAESTSRTDLVGGTRFLHDVGPRRYQVRYPAPNQPVQDQLPEHKRTSEATYEFEPSEWEKQFLIARNRRLAAFHQKHRPPD